MNSEEIVAKFLEIDNKVLAHDKFFKDAVPLLLSMSKSVQILSQMQISEAVTFKKAYRDIIKSLKSDSDKVIGLDLGPINNSVDKD